MTNLQRLEQRVQQLERQVTGHHQHGTLAARLSRLEDTVTGDPMQRSSIAQRLDEIEDRTTKGTVADRIDRILGEETTGDEVADRVERIERRLDRLEDGVADDIDPTDLETLLDRIEARLLALENAQREEPDR